jgi:hypothetical protein
MTLRSRWWLLSLLAVMLGTPSLAHAGEVASWGLAVPYSWPPAVSDHAMAYDSLRRVTVLFDDAPGTWEWDGASWTARTPVTSPPSRTAHAMAYDSGRGRTVVFGGWGNNVLLADTWEWDGVSWTEQTPALSPPPRSGHAMAYDTARRTTVLFGGGDPSGPLGDTWEWDGTSWIEQTPAASPQPREAHAMAYDSARGKTVLFGGEILSSSTCFGDTWEWDGTSWTQPTQPTPQTSPSPRANLAMAYDAAHGTTVLFGGAGSGNGFDQPDLGDTWEWDGTTWAERTPAASPSPRWGHAMAYDVAGREVILFGGAWGDGLSADAWAWDGTTWTERRPPFPATRESHAIAFDGARGKTVLFGGLGGQPSTAVDPDLADTWEWDGTRWTERTPSQSPPGRFGHGMAFDGTRKRTVLFGGAWEAYDSSNEAHATALSDTWEWDGTNWTLRTPPTSPSQRADHAMAFDSARGVTVLFGGVLPCGFPALPGTCLVFGDTWEWDGSNWTERTPAHSPAPRFGHAMAFDSVRRVTVLFGAPNPSVLPFPPANPGPPETWEWDGTNWTQMTPTAIPPGGAMAFDSHRGKTVLCNGAQTWEWDGSDWTQQAPAQDPPAGPMAFDVARGVTVLLGDGETWLYSAYGEACTANAQCDSASCFGGVCQAPCTPSDPCHAAGKRDPATGACSAGSPVACSATDPCHDPGTCDPLTGACSNPEKPEGVACCGGVCQSGVCVGSASSSSSCGGDGSGGGPTTTGGAGGAGATSGTGGLVTSSNGENAGHDLPATCSCREGRSASAPGSLAATALLLGALARSRPRRSCWAR